MSTAQTRENIVTLLENIIKRTELMERQSDSRNLLEVDLAMEDVRMLYRQLEVLRGQMWAQKPQPDPSATHLHKVTQEKPTDPKPTVTQVPETARNQASDSFPEAKAPVEKEVEKKTEEVPEKEPVTQTPVSKPEPKPADPTPEEKTPVTEPKAETPAKEAQQEKQAVAPSVTERAGKETEANQKAPVGEVVGNGKTIVGEKFNPEKSSVHERLAQIKDDKSIGARMQQKPVGNIKEAIGINEKFLFINELFNGDLKAYNDSIEKLNTVPSIHEAFAFLNELTNEFQWDGQRSAHTIERFANLVQRRHMDS